MMRILSLSLCLIALAGCSPYTSEFVELEGKQIEYQLVGDNTECFVLFEAGMGFDLNTWEDIFAESTKHCKTLRYSRLGQGDSQDPTKNLSAEQYADMVGAMLDKIGVDKPVIYVAHSYGANIARHFAVRFPEKTRALLLVDPATEWERDILMRLDPSKVESELAALKEMGVGYANRSGKGTISEMTDFWKKLPLPAYPDIADIPVTILVSTQEMPGPDLLLGSSEAMQVRADMIKQLATQFPRGKYVETNDSGHFIQDDEPELVIENLRELISNK